MESRELAPMEGKSAGCVFSWKRLWGMMGKEFIQMRRDVMTLRMMVMIPLLQLLILGYAINSDPKHLPTAVMDADGGQGARALVSAMKQSDYFDITSSPQNQAEADRMLRVGKAQFVLNIPADFTRTLLRGEKPTLLLEADATDPTATSMALKAFSQISTTVFDSERFPKIVASGTSPVDLRVHARYNPEGIQNWNTVPGIVGIILTMMMTMITGIAITRERERGTMENLLATPLHPAEVLIGKIVPYILVGYVQITLVILVAWTLFNIPVVGSVGLLYLTCLPFIVANLAMGITFSTIAKNQMQALQMTIFVFLPSMLLSGFMFPFRGMPMWAQWVGEVLPITHFLRICRGIILKGNGWNEIAGEVGAIVLFATIILTVAVKRYRKTLD
jgi:ABC-2 type transport system permease protein